MEIPSPQALAAAGVRFVRVVWCDSAGVTRAKAVHVGRLGRVPEHGVGISAAMMAVPVMGDVVVPGAGVGPVGEVRLVPDWKTLTKLPYAPGHARVLGDMRRDGRPWPLCPRDFLKRMVAAAAARRLEVQAAFENEFYLLRPGPDTAEPADDTPFASTRAMDQHAQLIDALSEALLAQGIAVEQYYPESGPGQQELSVSHADPVSAADRQIAFRETARAVAQRFGLKASFLPKILANQAGNGCHVHLSLWRDGTNIMPDPAGPCGLAAEAGAFVAGLLRHLPALMALTTPSVNSYRRFVPHCWSGAFRCWGPDNREAAVRVPSDPSGRGSLHIELKTVDGSANPYLALGAILAAGLDGITRGREPGEPVTVDPGDLSDAARSAAGIDPLPANLATAIAHLEKNDVLLSALGPELARAFLAVRRAEWEALQDMELADEVKLLLERY